LVISAIRVAVAPRSCVAVVVEVAVKVTVEVVVEVEITSVRSRAVCLGPLLFKMYMPSKISGKIAVTPKPINARLRRTREVLG
jgi:hypothetical protein